MTVDTMVTQYGLYDTRIGPARNTSPSLPPTHGHTHIDTTYAVIHYAAL